MLVNKNPNIAIASIPASGTMRGRAIECDLARTLTATLRVSYHASGTVSARLNFYYSPDGINFDTIPYTYFDVDITAGVTIQETHNIDAPEVGYLIPIISNQDASYAISNVKLWTTISKHWEEFHEAIMQDAKRGG